MSLELPDNLLYTEEHEWIDPETGWVGITDYAQQQLGDIVFVDLPNPGKTVSAGDGLLVVESVKSVSDVYAPASGSVDQVNESLESAPEQVNDDPYDAGKLIRLQVDSIPDTCLDSDGYREYIS